MPGVYNIQRDGTVIYKSLNTKNKFGRIIKGKLTTQYDRYKRAILGCNGYPQKFVGQALSVSADGAYSMVNYQGISLTSILPRRHGFRCGDTKYKVPDKSLALDMLKALLEIDMFMIRTDRTEERLLGDWPLHNLLYCYVDKQVKNIDLEGFFTYTKKSSENRVFGTAGKQLMTCMKVLVSIISRSEHIIVSEKKIVGTPLVQVDSIHSRFFVCMSRKWVNCQRYTDFRRNPVFKSNITTQRIGTGTGVENITS